MSDKNNNDFASAMFRKGSNTVDLVFAERFYREPRKSCAMCIEESKLLDMMLYSYLLGACACLNDQASFIELSQAIENIWP